MSKRKPSLPGQRRRSAVVGFFLFIELNIVLLAGLAISISTGVLKSNAQDGARRTAGATAVSLQHQMDAVFNAVNHTARAPEFLPILDSRPLNGDERSGVTGKLAALLATGIGFDRAFLTDGNGVILAYQPANPALIGTSLAKEPWYQQGRNTTTTVAGSPNGAIGSFNGTIGNGSPTIPIITPLAKSVSGGSAAGYVVGALDLGLVQA